MSPNEHYREAERLLAKSEEASTLVNDMLDDGRLVHANGSVDTAFTVLRMGLARAQVHATLATLGKRDEA